MSGDNELATQNADVAFQLRAFSQQLQLLSRMNMDLIDDLKSIRKQNIGANCKGNTVHKAVQNTRFDFEEVLDENVDVGEGDYDCDMESEREKSYCEGMSPLKDSEGDALSLPVAASLVMRSTLQVQVNVNEDESTQQKENIFQTRCYVQSKVCGLIIDSRSCVNVCSTTLVSKLNLSTVKHAKPYRLQWLNDSGEVKVTKQVVLPFSIGKYVDEVLCDVVPMQASHILLGRPWQYDRKAVHDGVRNRYTIVKDGKTITLVPLTPKQVHDDQIKLKREYDEAMGRENQGEDQGERIPSDSVKTQTTTTHSDSHPNANKSDHSTTTQKYPNLVECGGKTRGVKKVRKSDENCAEKLKKQPNFCAREGEVKSSSFTNKPMSLLVYTEAYFNTNDVDHIVPRAVVSLLQDFDDVYPDDTPSGLPPLRGIEHKINLVHEASILNRPAYIRNLEEIKELQRQVYELIDKGYIRESINPCVVPVLLMPKMDGTWRMCVVCLALNNIPVLIRGRILSRREGMMRTGPATLARIKGWMEGYK